MLIFLFNLKYNRVRNCYCKYPSIMFLFVGILSCHFLFIILSRSCVSPRSCHWRARRSRSWRLPRKHWKRRRGLNPITSSQIRIHIQQLQTENNNNPSHLLPQPARKWWVSNNQQEQVQSWITIRAQLSSTSRTSSQVMSLWMRSNKSIHEQDYRLRQELSRKSWVLKKQQYKPTHRRPQELARKWWASSNSCSVSSCCFLMFFRIDT